MINSKKFILNYSLETDTLKRRIRDRELYRPLKNAGPRIHSRIIDQQIAPEIYKVEQELSEKYPKFTNFEYDESELFNYGQPWIGLHPEVLQTPYSDFLDIFETIESITKIDTVVDFGCAYGRAAFVQESVFPGSYFLGYEFVEERAKEANRLFQSYDLINSKAICSDIFTCSIIDSNLYLIYDFSNETDIHHLLELLAMKTEDSDVFYIATIGSSSPKILKEYFPEHFEQLAASEKTDWVLFKSNEQ